MDEKFTNEEILSCMKSVSENLVLVQNYLIGCKKCFQDGGYIYDNKTFDVIQKDANVVEKDLDDMIDLTSSLIEDIALFSNGLPLSNIFPPLL